MIGIFFQSLFIGYSGAIMPGSLLTYTLEKSLKSGVKAGLIISIGHALLELVLVILLFLGVGKYLNTSQAQIIIGLIGGVILILTGISMVKDAYSSKIKIDVKDVSRSQNSTTGNALLGGIIISATNPYFLVWWAAVGLSLMMNAYKALGLTGIIIFYFGHIMSDITWYSLVSGVVGKTRDFIKPKVHTIIIGILGIFLIGFGASFIVSCVKLVTSLVI